MLLVAGAGDWAWDAEPLADGYLFCWSVTPSYWNLALCTDVGNVTTYSDDLFWQMWGIEQNSGSTMFFQVCGYNVNGNGSPCDTFDPIPPDWVCP